jgi:hypothetical protein
LVECGYDPAQIDELVSANVILDAPVPRMTR